MFFLAGQAATSALDLIAALEKTLASKNSSTPPANSQSFDLGAGSATMPAAPSTTAAAPLAPVTMDALLSVQGNSRTPMVNGDAFSARLFGMLDTNGDGAISQPEMDSIFNKNGDTTKADAIFARLDANHDGNVSLDELMNALSGQGQDDGSQSVHGHRHRHHLADFGGANSLMGLGNSNDPFGSNDPFAGDTSQTMTNADGSTTTTISYGDGAQVTMTLPAAKSTGASPSAMAHNMIERMIQRQVQMMAASSSFALSA